MIEVTKQSLIDVIKQINTGVDNLKKELQEKNKEIEELKSNNQHLKQSNKSTLDQIRQYIQELEKIRTHYVDSNNHPK